MSNLSPQEIEIRSMEIIDGLLPAHTWSSAELAVVKRLVHTSGDPSLAEVVRFHPQAAEAGMAALARGVAIFTDVHMVRIGMTTYKGEITCAISDADIAAAAKATGRTRAQTAMRAFGSALDGAIVAIGNAPTALREVLALAAEGIARPALVIGMPVGFVDAAESKDALMASDLVYITIAGTRGGSPLAATTVNALVKVLG